MATTQRRWKRLQHTALSTYEHMLASRLGALETRILGLELDRDQASPGSSPVDETLLAHLNATYQDWQAELDEVRAAIAADAKKSS